MILSVSCQIYHPKWVFLPSIYTSLDNEGFCSHRLWNSQHGTLQRVCCWRGRGSRRRNHRKVLFPHSARAKLLQLLVPACTWIRAFWHWWRSCVSKSMGTDWATHQGIAAGGSQQDIWRGLPESRLPLLPNGLSRLWFLLHLPHGQTPATPPAQSSAAHSCRLLRTWDTTSSQCPCRCRSMRPYRTTDFIIGTPLAPNLELPSHLTFLIKVTHST